MVRYRYFMLDPHLFLYWRIRLKEILLTETILLHLKWQQYVHICKDGMPAGGWHDRRMTLWPKYVSWDHPVTGVARGSVCRTHLMNFVLSLFFLLYITLPLIPVPWNTNFCTPTSSWFSCLFSEPVELKLPLFFLHPIK